MLCNSYFKVIGKWLLKQTIEHHNAKIIEHKNVKILVKEWCKIITISSVQFSSVAQPCSTLCDPMNRSTAGLPVHHLLAEFTQTHMHRVSDAIQPSHPPSSPSSPAPSSSQHQSIFQWVNSSHEVAKVLEFQPNIIPSKEIPGLISFRMDCLDLLAVQGTLKISKASILQLKWWDQMPWSTQSSHASAICEPWTSRCSSWF